MSDHHTTAEPLHICGVHTTLQVIGKKWTILILHALCEHKKRFGELERELSGISPRTLSLRLQELESCGVLTKHVFARVPPHVEYALTPKGRSLKKIIVMMKRWGDDHAEATPESAKKYG